MLYLFHTCMLHTCMLWWLPMPLLHSVTQLGSRITFFGCLCLLSCPMLSRVVAHQELESRVTPLNAEYWECLLTLADHELEAQRWGDRGVTL